VSDNSGKPGSNNLGLTSRHFISESQVNRAWILFQQRADSGWSFTDCTSKIVIHDLGTGTAVALDEHIRQFGVAVFP